MKLKSKRDWKWKQILKFDLGPWRIYTNGAEKKIIVVSVLFFLVDRYLLREMPYGRFPQIIVVYYKDNTNYMYIICKLVKNCGGRWAASDPMLL